MLKRGRGRPRKIKKLDQYTLSELRDMPMGSMMKLFFNGIVGKKSVVISSMSKTQQTSRVLPRVSVKKNNHQDDSAVSELMGMTLEKKADYLTDALMGYLKKTK